MDTFQSFPPKKPPRDVLFANNNSNNTNNTRRPTTEKHTTLLKHKIVFKLYWWWWLCWVFHVQHAILGSRRVDRHLSVSVRTCKINARPEKSITVSRILQPCRWIFCSRDGEEGETEGRCNSVQNARDAPGSRRNWGVEVILLCFGEDLRELN